MVHEEPKKKGSPDHWDQIEVGFGDKTGWVKEREEVHLWKTKIGEAGGDFSYSV